VRIYQRATGGPWWVGFTDSKGNYVRQSLGTRDQSEAQRKAYEIALGKAEGKTLVGEKAEVTSLIDQFLKQHRQLRPRSHKRLQGQLKMIRKRLGKRSVIDRDFRGAVKAYRAKRLEEGRAVRTVNAEVSALRQVIVWARDVYPDLENPLADLRRLRVPRTEARALGPSEVRRLLAALRTPEERLRVGLFLYTGFRKSEGIHLWWSHVDLERGVISIEPHEGFVPKNGEPRLVPICPALERILQSAPRRSTYVLTTQGGRPFVADDGNPLTRWVQRLYRRAGIAVTKGMGLHTLRHTYCSHLARQNIRAEIRAKLVGHRTLAVQDVYSHTFEQDALEAGRGLRYA